MHHGAVRRGRLRGIAVVALLALAAGGCGPGGDTPEDPPGEGEPPPEEPEPGPEPGAEGDPEPTDDPGEGEEDPDPGEPEEPEQPVEVEASVVATGLEVPWEIVFTPGDRVFVTERDRGVVSELHDDGSTEEVARFEVDPAGEGGLLGLAASPDFADDTLLYAYYTTSDDNRVVRFPADGSEEGAGEEILTGIPRDQIHNGGRIAFGPDDRLYVSTGDAGEGSRSQDPDSLAGKILRLTPDGDVPDDNPEDGSPVYALGLRNVQGLAWDDEGRLYANEFGPQVDDEINVIEPGGNYGWPEVTGEAGVDGFIDPIVVRQPPDASWSGATVLRDDTIPRWEGDLFAAALRGERLWRFDLDDGAVAGEEELLAGEFGRLRRVAQAPDGALWILTSNRDGRGDPVADDDRIIRFGPADDGDGGDDGEG